MHNLELIEIVHVTRERELSRDYGNFPDIPETFQRFQKISRDSRKFSQISGTFQRFWKHSRDFGNIPEAPN